MRTEAKPINSKTGKVETKRVKGKALKSFYYEDELVKKGDICEGFRHDFEQWPSKVQIIEEKESIQAGGKADSGKDAGKAESKPKGDK